jgi:tRNA 2-selenouridine synthase
MNAPLPPGPPPRVALRADVSQWSAFAERIDVRSPSEFAEDHLPGAINLPVLDDAERTLVGTMYVQQSAFEARKVGAALVSRNVAHVCETHVRDKPREWSPLVYCWRGGQRSRSLVHVLAEIGFRAAQLDGGYRAYRRHVVAMLEQYPKRFRFRVVCGLTGSGKSRLLAALAEQGAQVLDLERLAQHRGSLLGELPSASQPTQKLFETELYAALSDFDATKVVFVESESRRIGRLQIPDALLASMRAAECIRVEAPKAQRIAMLAADYAHWLDDAAHLEQRLASLIPLYGKATIAQWVQMARQGLALEFTEQLLDTHYDAYYERAMRRNFPRYQAAAVVTMNSASDYRRIAHDLVAQSVSIAGTEAA